MNGIANSIDDQEAPWVAGYTIGDVLRQTTRRFPDQDAVYFMSNDIRWSWARLDQEVDTVARSLLALGLRRGDHFGIWATNVPEWVVLQFATARIGVILVTINPSYRTNELAYAIKQSELCGLASIDHYKSTDYFAALNAAVFSDGSFCYIPKNTRCPLELSSYFRINTAGSGQFERTLIICEAHSYVSYLEGCTAPAFDTNQLHAAVVELVALDNAEIKYSTVQNWYAGDPESGKGGIYNFVTKRGKCQGKNSKISWTQIETGSAITWKYPSCILLGDNSIGEFYSVALTNHHQQADTGSKMLHIGKNTKSTIISKGISVGHSSNSYRGQVKVLPSAENARNYTQCDSMLIGRNCTANTFPYINVANNSARVEHEASTSKINEEQLFYFAQRGISQEKAIEAIISGFCGDVFKQLPTEFAVEADKLLGLKLENSVG